MMPSSFFFHQAAEIGLNPSQFLTYIIKVSLKQRSKNAALHVHCNNLLNKLTDSMHHEKTAGNTKLKVAVLLGGYSSERHISVESGRNIYEKLSSSAKYQPIPVFLTGNKENIQMYQLPINLLLKDNADDIKEKIEHYKVHPIIEKIMDDCRNITKTYSSLENIAAPKQLSFQDLKNNCQAVFIALHGRPGEDGAIQKELEKVDLPYNGSRTDSSEITINKYLTNEILMKHGFHVAQHSIASKENFKKDTTSFIKDIESKFTFPFIAKHVDDGCSSAVRKVKTDEELKEFAK
jgi:D-alanine-D-alanine ligase